MKVNTLRWCWHLGIISHGVVSTGQNRRRDLSMVKTVGRKKRKAQKKEKEKRILPFHVLLSFLGPRPNEKTIPFSFLQRWPMTKMRMHSPFPLPFSCRVDNNGEHAQ